MAYYGPRVKPQPDIGPSTADRIQRAFLRIEERPMRQLKEDLTRAQAVRMGLIPADAERIKRREAPNSDRQRGSGTGPSGPSGQSGRERPTAPEGAGPPGRRQSPEDAARSAGINFQPRVERGGDPQVEGGGAQLFQEAISSNLRSAGEGPRETAGRPPGDVEYPMGLPATGPDGAPVEAGGAGGAAPASRPQEAPDRGRRIARGFGPEDPYQDRPSYRFPSGAEYRPDRPGDLGEVLAGAFQERQAGYSGRYTAEAIERQPDLGRYALFSPYDDRRESRFEVTEEMVRSTSAPPDEKEAAIEAIRSGRQRAAYNWYVGWRGPESSRGGSLDPDETMEYSQAMSDAIDMVDGGMDVSEATRRVSRQYGVPLDPGDVGLAYERSQDPERFILRRFGQPQGRLAEHAFEMLRRGAPNPATVRRRLLDRFPDASQEEIDQLNEFLTPKIDPMEMYLGGRTRDALYGPPGGQ